jgi:hypothetical protein
MSTMTTLETYDAPMMDYSGDTDISMHAGPSTELWTYDEVTMGDDALTQNTEHESVEVDMEDYNNLDVEYEMADGDHSGDVELPPSVDVEVYPAASAPVVEPLNTVIDSTVLDTRVIDPDPGIHPTLHANAVEPSVLESEYAKKAENVAETAPVAQDRDVTHTAPVTEPTATPIEEPRPAEVARTSDTAEASSGEAALLPNPFVATEVAAQLVEQDATGYHQEPSGEGAAEMAAPAEVEPPKTGEDVDDVQEYAADITADQQQEPAVGDVADPHEISDGVYIDPPPAVLLTIADEDEPSCSLFNHPASRSGSRSPGPQQSGDPTHTHELLLHSNPMLYYEPLSRLFDALRQETRVAEMPSSSNGELVLDVYDLQLTISEVRQ